MTASACSFLKILKNSPLRSDHALHYKGDNTRQFFFLRKSKV